MIGTWKAFQSLTQEQKAVLESKSIQGSYTPRALIELLQPLAVFDKKSDSSRMGLGCTAAVLVVVALIMLCSNPFGNAVSIVLAVIAAGAATALIVMTVRLSKVNLSNNFRLVALPFFAVLQEDMEPGETARVKLDLMPTASDEKKISTSDPYAKGAYHKIVDTMYEDDWFDGSAKLADGSVLAWAIHEELKVSQRTKRNARGKYKTKTRHYKRARITVDVSLPSKAYSVDASPPASGDTRVQAKEGAKRTMLRLTRKVKVKSEDPIHPRVFLELIAEAYRRARPAQGGAR